MANVLDNPDGTSRALMPADDRLTRVTPPDIDADPGSNVNALFAAQIALHDILAGLVVRISDYDAIIQRQQPGVARSFTLERVTIDYPKVEDEIKPLCACIMEGADQEIDPDHNAGIVKVDYSDTHSLERLAHTKCTLQLEAWFGHKEERRAFRTAFVRALLKEPRHERSDRLVVVDQYFGTAVRLVLTRQRFPESADAAQSNHWTFQAIVEANVPELVLVPRKAAVRVEARVHTKVPDSQ